MHCLVHSRRADAAGRIAGRHHPLQRRALRHRLPPALRQETTGSTWRRGEGPTAGRAVHRAYCALHSDAQREKDIGHATAMEVTLAADAPVLDLGLDAATMAEKAILPAIFSIPSKAPGEPGSQLLRHCQDSHLRLVTPLESRCSRAAACRLQGPANALRKEARIRQHLDRANAAAYEAHEGREAERRTLTRVRLELESLRILVQRINKREKLKRDGKGSLHPSQARGRELLASSINLLARPRAIWWITYDHVERGS